MSKSEWIYPKGRMTEPCGGIYAGKTLGMLVPLATVPCWAKVPDRVKCYHCSHKISIAGHGEKAEKKGEAVGIVL